MEVIVYPWITLDSFPFSNKSSWRWRFSGFFFFHSLYFPDGKSVYKLKPVTQIVAEENVLRKNQISLCKIALYAIAVSKRFHLNSYTIGFHPQMS